MTSYVLFSPIGTSDPVSEYHDGAMIHICRKYKPTKVYLYLSQEMLDLQSIDDRYKYCLNKLREELQYEFKIIEIKRPGLVEVHKFDIFYEDFEEILRKISDEDSNHQILLNISSGTPAMKSALQTIAALSENHYTAIQVASPEKKSNPKKQDIKEYDVALEWECNADNSGNYEDRATKSKHTNLLTKFKKEMICKHIDVYDYNAALSIANDIKKNIKEDGLKLLEAANCRLHLDKSGIQKALNGKRFEIIPIEQGDERNIFEFLLWLQIKQKRGDYADFIRGLTPVVVDLFEVALKKHCRIDIKDYCEKNIRNGIEYYKMTRNKLQQSEIGVKILNILDRKFNGYNDSVYTSVHLSCIIEEYNSDNEFTDVILKIRNVEEAARNLAAHEIVSITDEWIQKRCGISSFEVMKLLKKVAEKSGIRIRKTDWDSYNEMNRLIKERL